MYLIKFIKRRRKRYGKRIRKKLFLDVKYNNNYNTKNKRYQIINDKENNIHFSVCNLRECPEDAIIGRDLFDVDDYVKALRNRVNKKRLYIS